MAPGLQAAEVFFSDKLPSQTSVITLIKKPHKPPELVKQNPQTSSRNTR